jgi:WD40 repeat protein/ADP-ribose pyrophosphatase YjhB (NUDIX family)
MPDEGRKAAMLRDTLWEEPRSQRARWQQFLSLPLAKAVVTTREQVASVLRGNFAEAAALQEMQQSKQIRTFVSSTFTDTENERNLLIEDVYPFLKALGRKFGVEVAQFSEMRWGVRAYATEHHLTSSVCMEELERSNKASGISYVLIMGQKYGYRPFPAKISQPQFEAMLKNMRENGDLDGAEVASAWFELDTNNVPPHYQLKCSAQAGKDWWGIFEILQASLRAAALCLETQADRESFEISATQDEARSGMLNKDLQHRMERTFVYHREFDPVPPVDDLGARSFIDLDSSTGTVSVDHDAQACMARMRLEVNDCHAPSKKFGELGWVPTEGVDPNSPAHAQYLREFCDHYCDLLANSVMKVAAENGVSVDPLAAEASAHLAFAAQQWEHFIEPADDSIGEGTAASSASFPPMSKPETRADMMAAARAYLTVDAETLSALERRRALRISKGALRPLALPPSAKERAIERGWGEGWSSDDEDDDEEWGEGAVKSGASKRKEGATNLTAAVTGRGGISDADAAAASPLALTGTHGVGITMLVSKLVHEVCTAAGRAGRVSRSQRARPKPFCGAAADSAVADDAGDANAADATDDADGVAADNADGTDEKDEKNGDANAARRRAAGAAAATAAAAFFGSSVSSSGSSDDTDGRPLVMVRFIGLTSKASTTASLLRSLCMQLYFACLPTASSKTGGNNKKPRRAGDETNHSLPSDAERRVGDADLDELVLMFDSLLRQAARVRAVLLLLDGIDRLTDTTHARGLLWLPRHLPSSVRIVVTCNDEGDGDDDVDEENDDAMLTGKEGEIKEGEMDGGGGAGSAWGGDGGRQRAVKSFLREYSLDPTDLEPVEPQASGLQLGANTCGQAVSQTVADAQAQVQTEVKAYLQGQGVKPLPQLETQFEDEQLKDNELDLGGGVQAVDDGADADYGDDDDVDEREKELSEYGGDSDVEEETVQSPRAESDGGFPLSPARPKGRGRRESLKHDDSQEVVDAFCEEEFRVAVLTSQLIEGQFHDPGYSVDEYSVDDGSPVQKKQTKKEKKKEKAKKKEEKKALKKKQKEMRRLASLKALVEDVVTVPAFMSKQLRQSVDTQKCKLAATAPVSGVVGQIGSEGTGIDVLAGSNNNGNVTRGQGRGEGAPRESRESAPRESRAAERRSYARNLRCVLAPSHVLRMPALVQPEAKALLRGWLNRKRRTLSDEQFDYVLGRCECGQDASRRTGEGASPIYLKLAVDTAASHWCSSTPIGEDGATREDETASAVQRRRPSDENYTDLTPIAVLPPLGMRIGGGSSGVTGLLDELLQRLYVVHGEQFVRAALGYTYISVDGLSIAELEDVLSLDDTVLRSVFEWWTPPVRRVPPLLLVRLWDDLADMVQIRRCSTGDGRIIFWSNALKERVRTHVLQGRRQKHTLLAQYFMGTWAAGKPIDSEKDEKAQEVEMGSAEGAKGGKPGDREVVDRLVNPQPQREPVAHEESTEGGGAASWEGAGMGRAAGIQGRTVARGKANRRRAKELPVHLMQAGMIEELQQVLCDPESVCCSFELGLEYEHLRHLHALGEVITLQRDAVLTIERRWKREHESLQTLGSATADYSVALSAGDSHTATAVAMAMGTRAANGTSAGADRFGVPMQYPLLILPAEHSKAKGPHSDYPERLEVADQRVSWKSRWIDYCPTEFNHPILVKFDCTRQEGGWADPPDHRILDFGHGAPQPWRRMSDGTGSGGGVGGGSIGGRRVSHTGPIKLDSEDGRPLNPIGRTGMVGRGLLGKWGPNHAADPIVTRIIHGSQYRATRNSSTGTDTADADGLGLASGMLQMVVIRRKDTGEWAIPGGTVDAGENVSATLRREFEEEAGNVAPAEKAQHMQLLDELFDEAGTCARQVFKGYNDDPRNTDNAWMETNVVHFHCSHSLGGALKLSAGDDAASVRWMDLGPVDAEGKPAGEWCRRSKSGLVEEVGLDPGLKMYSSHVAFVKHAVKCFFGNHHEQQQQQCEPMLQQTDAADGLTSRLGHEWRTSKPQKQKLGVSALLPPTLWETEEEETEGTAEGTTEGTAEGTFSPRRPKAKSTLAIKSEDDSDEDDDGNNFYEQASFEQSMTSETSGTLFYEHLGSSVRGKIAKGVSSTSSIATASKHSFRSATQVGAPNEKDAPQRFTPQRPSQGKSSSRTGVSRLHKLQQQQSSSSTLYSYAESDDFSQTSALGDSRLECSGRIGYGNSRSLIDGLRPSAVPSRPAISQPKHQKPAVRLPMLREPGKMKRAADEINRRWRLCAQWARFVQGHIHQLRRDPSMVYQVAANSKLHLVHGMAMQALMGTNENGSVPHTGAGKGTTMAVAKASASGPANRRSSRRRSSAHGGSECNGSAVWLERLNERRGDEPDLLMLLGHSGSITSCCFSADGRFLLSSSEDSTLKLWAIATGECLRTFTGHSAAVTGASFSPGSSSLIASVSVDRTLRLWDVEVGMMCCTNVRVQVPEINEVVPRERSATMSEKQAHAARAQAAVPVPALCNLAWSNAGGAADSSGAQPLMLACGDAAGGISVFAVIEGQGKRKNATGRGAGTRAGLQAAARAAGGMGTGDGGAFASVVKAAVTKNACFFCLMGMKHSMDGCIKEQNKKKEAAEKKKQEEEEAKKKAKEEARAATEQLRKEEGERKSKREEARRATAGRGGAVANAMAKKGSISGAAGSIRSFDRRPSMRSFDLMPKSSAAGIVASVHDHIDGGTDTGTVGMASVGSQKAVSKEFVDKAVAAAASKWLKTIRARLLLCRTLHGHHSSPITRIAFTTVAVVADAPPLTSVLSSTPALAATGTASMLLLISSAADSTTQIWDVAGGTSLYNFAGEVIGFERAPHLGGGVHGGWLGALLSSSADSTTEGKTVAAAAAAATAAAAAAQNTKVGVAVTETSSLCLVRHNKMQLTVCEAATQQAVCRLNEPSSKNLLCFDFASPLPVGKLDLDSGDGDGDGAVAYAAVSTLGADDSATTLRGGTSTSTLGGSVKSGRPGLAGGIVTPAVETSVHLAVAGFDDSCLRIYRHRHCSSGAAAGTSNNAVDNYASSSTIYGGASMGAMPDIVVTSSAILPNEEAVTPLQIAQQRQSNYSNANPRQAPHQIECIRTLHTPHAGAVTCTHFSNLHGQHTGEGNAQQGPGGAVNGAGAGLLATGSTDGTICLWDVALLAIEQDAEAAKWEAHRASTRSHAQATGVVEIQFVNSVTTLADEISRKKNSRRSFLERTRHDRVMSVTRDGVVSFHDLSTGSALSCMRMSTGSAGGEVGLVKQAEMADGSKSLLVLNHSSGIGHNNSSYHHATIAGSERSSGVSSVLMADLTKGTTRTLRIPGLPPRLVCSMSAVVDFVAYVPGGIGDVSREVRLWDVKTNKSTGIVLGGHSSEIVSVELSVDGRLLVVTLLEGEVHLWDWAHAMPHARQQSTAQYSKHKMHDKKNAPGANVQGHADGRAQRILVVRDRSLDRVILRSKLSSCGTKLLSMNNTRRIKVFDLFAASQKHKLENHMARADAASTSSSVTFASTTPTKVLPSFTSSSPANAMPLPVLVLVEPAILDGSSTVVAAEWDPSGRYLATGAHDSTIRIWQANAPYRCPPNHMLRDRSGTGRPANCLAFCTSGDYLASSSSELNAPPSAHSVAVWSLRGIAKGDPPTLIATSAVNMPICRLALTIQFGPSALTTRTAAAAAAATAAKSFQVPAAGGADVQKTIADSGVRARMGAQVEASDGQLVLAVGDAKGRLHLMQLHGVVTADTLPALAVHRYKVKRKNVLRRSTQPVVCCPFDHCDTMVSDRHAAELKALQRQRLFNPQFPLDFEQPQLVASCDKCHRTFRLNPVYYDDPFEAGDAMLIPPKISQTLAMAGHARANFGSSQNPHLRVDGATKSRKVANMPLLMRRGSNPIGSAAAASVTRAATKGYKGGLVM